MEFEPTIEIVAYTAFSAQDFGDVNYTVIDTKHYGSKDCNYRKLDSGELYESKFFVYGTINPVVKGKGCFLINQFQDIIDKLGLTLTLQEFTSKMALYSLSKYILAFLLYGRFSLEFLTSTFNSTFLNDLANSRFSNFLPLYTDPINGLVGFENYFRKKVNTKRCR